MLPMKKHNEARYNLFDISNPTIIMPSKAIIKSITTLVIEKSCLNLIFIFYTLYITKFLVFFNNINYSLLPVIKLSYVYKFISCFFFASNSSWVIIPLSRSDLNFKISSATDTTELLDSS